MKVFNENLYFVTTGAENFFEIIAYRSNAGRFNIGDNALDLLGVGGEERGFLIRNLFIGGDSPIVVMSERGALIISRRMLYSTGICCVAQPDFAPDVICLLFEREMVGKAIISPAAKALAAEADENGCGEAYLGISRLERLLYFLGERGDLCECDMINTAAHICEGVGCDMVADGQPVEWQKFVRGGMIYSNSIYALSVLLFAFLAKIISDDRRLSVSQSADGVRLFINSEGDAPEVRTITDYILLVAAERGIDASVDTSCGIRLDICPFFVDIGLTGVKNPSRLEQE